MPRGIEQGLVAAQRAIARDEQLRQLLLDAVLTRKRSAAGAIAEAEAHFSAMLAASDNRLLRERVLDIRMSATISCKKFTATATACRARR